MIEFTATIEKASAERLTALEEWQLRKAIGEPIRGGFRLHYCGTVERDGKLYSRWRAVAYVTGETWDETEFCIGDAPKLTLWQRIKRRLRG